MLFRDSKKVRCKLVLTGKVDKIICVCGNESEINFYLSKLEKKKVVLNFVEKHKKCGKLNMIFQI